jgi:hypothetical protein
VHARRDGRTDRARADDSNAYAHLREAIALPFIQKHSRATILRSPADGDRSLQGYSDGEPAHCRRTDSWGSMEHFHQSH